MFERPRGQEGEVTGERISSLPFSSNFEGVECLFGWTFSLSRTALPFSVHRTSSKMYAVNYESSGDKPADSFGVFVSSSSLDEGEGRSLSLLDGGARSPTGGFTTGVEFMLGVTAAVERRLLSAMVKTSLPPFESDADPTEEVVAEVDLEASIRDSTDSTVFLF